MLEAIKNILKFTINILTDFVAPKIYIIKNHQVKKNNGA